MSDRTANVPKMLYDDGVTGAKADAITYEVLRLHSPDLVSYIRSLVERGFTADRIGQGIRDESRKRQTKPNEAHIANCMAVARHIQRKGD